MHYKAVIFDLGGVLFSSPLVRLEQVKTTRPLDLYKIFNDPMFAELERGKIDQGQFIQWISYQQTKNQPNSKIDWIHEGNLVMKKIMGGLERRKEWMDAIDEMKSCGLKVGVITNNFYQSFETVEKEDLKMAPFKKRFDCFIESRVVGIRKPNQEIYRLAYEDLQVSPKEVIYLDDIGGNLKAPKAMGTTTIHVLKKNPRDALEQLRKILIEDGYPLLKPRL